ncbi:hypothetical protein T484DRAFT_2025148 [Baffinella frigidus]|nr:hypothetical protein T484DRAFT_2025148 [Cryptophyta sp. CCMP2293]
MTSVRRVERTTSSRSEEQLPPRSAPVSPQPAKGSRDKGRRASMFGSFRSLASTMLGGGSPRGSPRGARSCEEAAPIELPSASRPILRAAPSVPSPAIENVRGISVRSAHGDASITFQLPRVSLSFLQHQSPMLESQGLQEACEDDLFRGRIRSIADLSGMLDWLEDPEARRS